MEDLNESFLDETNEETPEYIRQFFGNPKDFLATYTHCTVCGSHLHFTHTTDFARNCTQETARCLECATEKPRLLKYQLH